MKTQRKQGAPKPNETFHEMFAESASTHAEMGKWPRQKITGATSTPHDPKKPEQVSGEQTRPPPAVGKRCHNCKEFWTPEA